MPFPDGRARGLPKSGRFSALTFKGSTASWDSATNNIAVPAGLLEDDVLFYFLGTDALQWGYVMGAGQDHLVAPVKLVSQIQGTNAVEAHIGMIRKQPRAAWPTTLDHNSGATALDSQVVLAFTPSPGFQGRLLMAQRLIPGNVSSFVITPPRNPGPLTGGTLLVNATFDSGGSGPNTPANANGWRYVASGLMLTAFYLLPPDKVFTPPAITISAGRTDTWAVCLAYVA